MEIQLWVVHFAFWITANIWIIIHHNILYVHHPQHCAACTTIFIFLYFIPVSTILS
jgi:hypothetical protein